MALELYIGGRKPRFSSTADMLLPVPEAVTGAWLFNRRPGASDSEARETGRRNRVPGALNGPNVNVLEGTLPTVFDNFWRFAPDGPLRTNIPDTPNMTILILARSVGAIGPSPNAAYLAGTYGNTATRGFGIEMNSALNIRAVAYDSVGVKTNQVGVVGSHAPWRIFRAQVSAAGLSLNNLTADGGTPTPGVTAIIGGRGDPGNQTLSIGARVAPGSAAYAQGIDIAAVITTSGNWDSGEQSLMLEQMRAQRDLALITEGAA